MPTQTPPINDADAKGRFQQNEQRDPLPDVPAALLNSGDIYDYACITGMIGAFPGGEEELKKKLKPASYEADFLGEVFFTDDQGNPQEMKIEEDTVFPLAKNSIAYVYLKITFRLPDYIALRFNLRIAHVHRGLLLGTGPLIDPGFCGRLLIPLHNLTSEDYNLIGGDGLIWVEFTKLSPHHSWDTRARRDSYDFVRFPENKRYRTAQQYLIKATGGVRPPKSSIPGEIRDAKDAAEKAKDAAVEARKAAEKAEQTSKVWATLGSVAVIAGVVALVYSSWDLFYSANKNIADYHADVNKIGKGLTESQQETRKQVDALAALTARISALETVRSAKPSTPTRRRPERRKR